MMLVGSTAVLYIRLSVVLQRHSTVTLPLPIEDDLRSYLINAFGQECRVWLRDPVEVIASQLIEPGGRAHLGPSRPNPHRESRTLAFARGGLDAETVPITDFHAQVTIVEFYARVIGLLCQTAAEDVDERCRVIDYSETNVDCYRRIADFFGITLPSPVHAGFRAALVGHSKEPVRRLAEVPLLSTRRPGMQLERRPRKMGDRSILSVEGDVLDV
jgi:hypothetical protein